MHTPLRTAPLGPLLLGAAALLLGAPAAGGPLECQQCCKDQGLFTCPTSLRVYGPGSQTSKEVGGVRVNGFWRLDCEEGARFEAGGTVVVAGSPVDGEVLLVGSPLSTVECFRDHCALPQGACLKPRGGAMVLQRCADGQPLSSAQMQIPGAAPVSRIVLPAPAASPSAVVVPAATPVATPTPGAFGPHLPPDGPLPLRIDFPLPNGPGARCVSIPALLAESTRLVDQGDQQRIAEQLSAAAESYRAAVTVDRCNAIAWTALGQLALAADQLDIALGALRYAVALRPEHYGAQTSLGLAWEAWGDRDKARQAYEAALKARPGHPAAEDGLRRLGR